MIDTIDGWKRTLALPTGATFEQMFEFFGIPPSPAEHLGQNIRAKRRTWHHMANSGNPVGRAKAKEVETLIQRLSRTLLRRVPWDADGGGATVEIPDPVFETLDELWRIVTEYVFAADYDQALLVAGEAGSRLAETADAAAVLAWVLATGFNTGNLFNPVLLADGLAAADSAVRGQPHEARNWESKVSLLIAGNRLQDALAALEEAAKAVTGQVTARLHIMRARVAVGLGRPEEAMVAAVRAVSTALAAGDEVPAIRSEATDLLVAWLSDNLLPIRSPADLARYVEMVDAAAWCSYGVPDAEDQVRAHRMWAANAGKPVFVGSWKLRSFLAVCTGFISLPIHNFVRSSPAWKVFYEGLIGRESGDAFAVVAFPPYVQRVHRLRFGIEWPPMQGSSVPRGMPKAAGPAVRWLVVAAGALAVFFGCWGGLAAARVADTGTEVGIAAVPLTVALAILATWAARSPARASQPDDAPDLEAVVDRAARDSERAEAGSGGAYDRGDGGHRGSDDGGRHYEDGSPPRFLTGILPDRVPVDARISLLVQITLAAAQGASAALEPFPVSPSGTTVTITVSAPALSPLGDLEQDLTVPPNADSRLVRFGFIARPAGLHMVQVRAFIGGTFLGELALQISVEPGAALEEGRPRIAPITRLSAEPGEVTLQVSRTAGGYSFQLLSEALYPMVLIDRLAGDPGTVVEQIVAELRAMSKGQSQFSTSALVRKRLRSLGARLWTDVVPATIREQFWAQRDRIGQFTIASDLDTVPWELLYPVDLENEDGFLVEQFPVVRRVYGQGRARVLRVNKGVGFIVPPRSPSSAMTEVTAVRSVFPPDMVYRGTQAGLAEVLELLDAVPSVLHFAGHNAFTDQIGSLISLDGGPLRPDDLYPAKQKRAFEDVSPLVFFNGCRTAGEIPGFTQMNGWAQEFMGAGAAAFIGSLWAVRSSSAMVFAQEFYRALVRDRQPLGVASQHARQVIAADEGDPTWLAYAVYGNPSATIEDSPHRNL